MGSQVLAKKEVNFHGIWKAGLKVSENLMKSIGDDGLTKPSRICSLILTSAGLILDVPEIDGKTRKLEKIPFDILRNISVNPYQSKCLVVTYIDSNRSFSVMGFSSEDEKDFEDICKKYQDQKNNVLLQKQNLNTVEQPHVSHNWTLAPKQNVPRSVERTRLVNESYLKTSTKSEASNIQGTVPNVAVLRRQKIAAFPRTNQRYSYPQTATSDRDVFPGNRWIVVREAENLAREQAVTTQHGRAEAFHVGLQTLPYDDDFDVDSITSAMALQSTRNSEEVGEAAERPDGISAEMYYRRIEKHGHSMKGDKHIEANNSDEHQHRDNSHRGVKLTNENETASKHPHEKPTYDLRSVAAQTVNGNISIGRYTKNLSRTPSNSYKGKAEAQRKKSSSSGPMSPTASGPDPSVRPDSSVTSSKNHSIASSSQRSRVGSNSASAQVVKRTPSVGSTTIIKPIETVYLGRSARRVNSARVYRPIIVYAPVPHNRHV